jgi:hypothetical protein
VLEVIDLFGDDSTNESDGVVNYEDQFGNIGDDSADESNGIHHPLVLDPCMTIPTCCILFFHHSVKE